MSLSNSTVHVLNQFGPNLAPMSQLGIVRDHLAAKETDDRPGSEKQGGSGKGHSHPQRKNMENHGKTECKKSVKSQETSLDEPRQTNAKPKMIEMHDAASAIAMLPWVIARNHMVTNTLRVSSAERPVACAKGSSFR